MTNMTNFNINEVAYRGERSTFYVTACLNWLEDHFAPFLGFGEQILDTRLLREKYINLQQCEQTLIT